MKRIRRESLLLVLLVVQPLILQILAGSHAAMAGAVFSLVFLVLTAPVKKVSDSVSLPPPLILEEDVSDNDTETVSDTRLPATRGEVPESSPVVILLDRLAGLPDVFEVVAAGLAWFREWTGACSGRVALLDPRGDGFLFSKDDRGHFEKRPRFPDVFPLDSTRKIQELLADWRAEDKENGRDLTIPLRIGDSPLGFFQLEGTDVRIAGGEMPIAVQLFSLALLVRLLRHTPLPIMQVADGELLESCLERGSEILCDCCRGNRLMMLGVKREEDWRYKGPEDDLETVALRWQKLCRSLRVRLEEERGILVQSPPDGEIDLPVSSFLLGRLGRGVLLLTREQGEFNYREILEFRRIRDLLELLFQEFERREMDRERECRRSLLAILSRDLEDTLRLPDAPDGFQELLTALTRQLDIPFLALLSAGSPPGIYASGDTQQRESLLELLRQGNLSEWLFDTPVSRDLSELDHLQNALQEFAEICGGGRLIAQPLAGGGGQPVLLLIVIPPGVDSLEPLLNRGEGFPRLLLTLLAALVSTQADRQDRARVRRELERLERLAAIGRVAAGVAHEIRNPLGGIELYVSSLLSSIKDEKSLRWLGDIREAVTRMKRILSDLLLFAREESLQLQPLALDEIAREAVTFARERCKDQGAIIELESSDKSLLVSGDSIRLRQVIDNLLANASEAISPGGKILVRCRREGAQAVLTVLDDGPGIPDDTAGRIFDPFFTTRNTGTGLGLAISLKLVQTMGGTLTIIPSDLGGAGFRLALPLGE